MALDSDNGEQEMVEQRRYDEWGIKRKEENPMNLKTITRLSLCAIYFQLGPSKR